MDVLRIGLVQPIVPAYRVPVFQRLAIEPTVELTIWADVRAQGSLDPGPSCGDLVIQPAPLRSWRAVAIQPTSILAAVKAPLDILVMCWNARHLDLVPALMACRARGIGTVLWGHGLSKRERAWRTRIRNQIGCLADACIFYNHAAARDFQIRTGRKCGVFVAPNAISQADIAAARQSWLSDPDRLRHFANENEIEPEQTIIVVSRLEADKRIDLLISCVPTFRRWFPKFKLIIVGKGSQAALLHEQATRVAAADAIQFLGPIYLERELAPWCLCSSIFVMPEAVGLGVLHAFGYGLPVVTSDNASIHNPEFEALAHGQNAVLYRHGALESLQEAVGGLLNDSTTRLRLSRGALETVTSPKGYTVDRMIEGFLAAFDHVSRGRVQRLPKRCG